MSARAAGVGARAMCLSTSCSTRQKQIGGEPLKDVPEHYQHIARAGEIIRVVAQHSLQCAACKIRWIGEVGASTGDRTLMSKGSLGAAASQEG
eukprot:1159081-Pelagomonas_calceolata.AAC.11